MARLQQAGLNGIMFDALINFDRNYEANIPDYPVEKGYSVHDTIILQPTSISVTAYLTNTPVTFGRPSRNRVESIAKSLVALYEQKQLVTFTCSRGVFRNMGIESLTLPVNTDSKGAMEVSFTLKEVRTVGAATVSIPASYGKGGESGANAGTANTSSGSGSSGGTSEKAESQKSASLLYGVLYGR